MDNSDLEQLKSTDNTNKIIDSYIEEGDANLGTTSPNAPSIPAMEIPAYDPVEAERQGRAAAIDALSKEDKKTRRRQLNKLYGYFNSKWKNLFIDIENACDWSYASEIEIRDAIEECQEAVAEHDNKQFVKDAYYSGVGIVEALGPSIGLQVTGANQFIRKDKQIDELLEQIYLSKADMIQMAPEKKLAIATAKYMYYAHTINTTLPQRADMMKTKEVPADQAKKFADL